MTKTAQRMMGLSLYALTWSGITQAEVGGAAGAAAASSSDGQTRVAEGDASEVVNSDAEVANPETVDIPSSDVNSSSPAPASPAPPPEPVSQDTSSPSPPKKPSSQWRFALGGEFSSDSHGIFDLGYRRGPWAIQLFTDTLELSYEAAAGRFSGWGKLRGEAGIAGLMPFPWLNGAPAPELGHYASYVGGELGGMMALPYGLALGAVGGAYQYTFTATEVGTLGDWPASSPYVGGDVATTFSHRHLWARARAGLAYTVSGISPHADVVISATRRVWGDIDGLVLIHAGWAENTDRITRTRLGGLNPYSVPLAGAAWAEWWVEDYLATRVGLNYTASRTLFTGFMDGAAFDGQEALGLGFRIKHVFGWGEAEATVGYAPYILRQEGISRVTGYIMLARPWR